MTTNKMTKDLLIGNKRWWQHNLTIIVSRLCLEQIAFNGIPFPPDVGRFKDLALQCCRALDTDHDLAWKLFLEMDGIIAEIKKDMAIEFKENLPTPIYPN